MITILINTKNIYTRYAIKQLMQESVAHEENLIFVDSYTPVTSQRLRSYSPKWHPEKYFYAMMN